MTPTCIAAALILDYQLADSDGGLTSAGTLNQWTYAEPASPPAGTTPAVLWNTRPAGDTFNDTDERLAIRLPDIDGLETPVLLLEHAWEFGAGDTGRFQLEGSGGPQTLVPVYGYPGADAFRGSSDGYVTTAVSLETAEPGSSVILRFVADGADAGPGWALRSARVFSGDAVAPRLSGLNGPEDTQDLEGPHLVSVRVDEDRLVTRAEVVADFDGVEVRVPLVEVAGQYVGELPAAPLGTDVSYEVQVEDCSTSVTLEGAPYRVFLAAPTNLQGPDQPHEVATTAVLTWDPPDTPEEVLDYEVTELPSGETTVVNGPSIVVSLEPDIEQQFVVRARYAAGFGDPTPPLQLDVELPTLESVRPTAGFGGDEIWVQIQGRSLYMLDGLTTVAMEDVRTLEVDVLDVDRARALLAVDADAQVGPRDLAVTGGQGTFVFPDAFQILDAAAAPTIVSVQPPDAEQGETVTLMIVASEPFAGEASIVSDPDLLFANAPTIEGDQLEVTVAIAAGARPGPHSMVIDDGQRLWEADLEVTEFRFIPQRRCDCASGGGMGPLAFLVVLAVRRRRSRPV